MCDGVQAGNTGSEKYSRHSELKQHTLEEEEDEMRGGEEVFHILVCLLNIDPPSCFLFSSASVCCGHVFAKGGNVI